MLDLVIKAASNSILSLFILNDYNCPLKIYLLDIFFVLILCESLNLFYLLSIDIFLVYAGVSARVLTVFRRGGLFGSLNFCDLQSRAPSVIGTSTSTPASASAQQ